MRGAARTRISRPISNASSPTIPSEERSWTHSGTTRRRTIAPTRRSSEPCRQGLRRTESDRTKVLEWIGDRYIWFASPQNPDAIEIVYHASDFRGKDADPYGARKGAVHDGLAMVQPKPPAVLRTLVNLCMQVDDREDWDRIAWGTRSQRTEVLSYLKPYMAARDEATREKAALLVKVFDSVGVRYKAMGAWVEKSVRTKYGDRLPEFKSVLMRGASRERLDALERISRHWIGLILDESFIAAYRACADDPDVAVRRAVARTLNVLWFGIDRVPGDELIGLLVTLLNDQDRDVRDDAVESSRSILGQSRPPRRRREEVVRRLVSIALEDARPELLKTIRGAVHEDRDLAIKVLDESLRSADPILARASRAIYRDLTNHAPPGEQSRPEVRKGYPKALRDLHEHLGRVYPYFRLKRIDWDQVGRELLPRTEAVETEEQFGLLVMELVARLEDSGASVRGESVPSPDPRLPEWGPALACLIDDRGRPVVYDVGWIVPENAGLRPGMTVVSVNGEPAEAAIRRWMRREQRFHGYSSERWLRSNAVRKFLQQDEREAKVALVLERCRRAKEGGRPDGR